MTTELITQRIKYLIEHGGVLDDPLNDIRREVRLAVWGSGAAVALSAAQLLVTILN